MTPAEFLAVVLPSPGFGVYCAVELTNKKEHFYTESIADLVLKIEDWHNKKHETYFALAAFDEKRAAEKATYLRSFFVDLDGYETKRDAAVALDGFLQATGLGNLGNPWVVDSGGGLHAYWPLNEDIPAAIWKPVAENLKRLAKQFQFRIDMTVTADTARILRCPGTSNFKAKYKTPRPVRLVQEGDIFDLASFSTCIYDHVEAPYEAPAPKLELPGSRPKGLKDAAQVKLMENSVTLFANLAPHCAQVADYEANAQEDGKEPIWRGLLSWTKVCQDGDEEGLRLSKLHPYPESRMREKLAEIKGPYPCTKMDSENPGICHKCPHWGKVTNPLVLGREIKTDNAPKVIELKPVREEAPSDWDDTQLDIEENYDPEEPEEAPEGIVRPPPPRGYDYGQNGGVYVTLTEEDDEGKKVKRSIQLVPYDLFVVDILHTEEDHLIHMAAVRPDGVQTLNFPQKSIISKDETLKWLASNNIMATFSGHDKNLYYYIRACVGEASQNKRPLTVPTQCGWQSDGSFVYNYRVFSPDGRETRVPMPGLENINRNTSSRGNLKAWQKLWRTIFVDKPGMETALSLAISSFGASLMKFTEYEGFIWHIGSQWSGTGKSLVLSAQAGVWGHPLRYRTGKGTSPVAMQQRAGLLNSMPLLVDEITATQRANMEWAPSFIFDFAEGQGKERMESGSNKERINNSVWSTQGTLTANIKLTDYMAGARAHSSNGELLRMLEWSPHDKLIWTPEERRVVMDIKHHYGVAGEAWVRWIVRNTDKVKDVMGQVHKHLRRVMNFTDDERYWHAGCTTTVSAAILLRSEYSGILDVEINKVIAALKKLVDNARGVMRASVRTAEDVLNSYIENFYGNFVIIKKEEGGQILAKWSGQGDVADKSLTRTKVLGRVEIGIQHPDYREFFIQESMLQKHCSDMSFGYDEFKTQIAQMYKVTYIKKNMLAKTNGPVMRVNAMHMSLPEEAFDGDKLSVAEAKAR